MTVLLLVGYIPLMVALLVVGLYSSSQRKDSEAAKALGDRIGRRSGSDRRASELPFVGADRRSGVDRRAAQSDQAEHAA
jgi:FtsZ-interacting cell division protein ZipA